MIAETNIEFYIIYELKYLNAGYCSLIKCFALSKYKSEFQNICNLVKVIELYYLLITNFYFYFTIVFKVQNFITF